MSAAIDIEYDQDQESRLRRALQDLEQTGQVTPGKLLELARPQTSDIHECFEWEDATAAERFRMHQARTYIRTVKVTVEKVEASDRTLRIVSANDVVPPAPPPAPVPAPTASDLMIGRAKDDLASFHRKYKFLRTSKELASLFDEIELVIGTKPTAPAVLEHRDIKPENVVAKPKAKTKPAPVSREPGCENLVSRGVIKTGKSVKLPEMLRPENLPMRPPGRV